MRFELHRCLILQTAVRPLCVELPPPSFDHHFCFLNIIEYLHVQAFVSKFLCIPYPISALAAAPVEGKRAIVLENKLYAAGELPSVTPRKDGFINGSVTSYHRNGLVSSEEYVAGKANGRQTWYDEFGNERLSMVYLGLAKCLN